MWVKGPSQVGDDPVAGYDNMRYDQSTLDWNTAPELPT